jgi:hypothetical protein
MNRDKPERLPGFRRRSSLRKIYSAISQRLQFPLPSAKLANKVKERANKETGHFRPRALTAASRERERPVISF